MKKNKKLKSLQHTAIPYMSKELSFGLFKRESRANIIENMRRGTLFNHQLPQDEPINKLDNCQNETWLNSIALGLESQQSKTSKLASFAKTQSYQLLGIKSSILSLIQKSLVSLELPKKQVSCIENSLKQTAIQNILKTEENKFDDFSRVEGLLYQKRSLEQSMAILKQKSNIPAEHLRMNPFTKTAGKTFMSSFHIRPIAKKPRNTVNDNLNHVPTFLMTSLLNS